MKLVSTFLLAASLGLAIGNVFGQTKPPGFNSTPCYSPSGDKIAFTSARDGNREIYVMDADGSNQTRVTRYDSIDISPSWSPDGKQIAFFSQRAGSFELCIVNIDGSNNIQVTDGYQVLGKPLWMPDGKTIIFTGNITGNFELYSINLDTKQVINLTNHPASDDGPALVPNSGRISFHSTRDTLPRAQRMYTMEKDGSDVKRLLPTVNERHHSLSWSPDGSKFAFVSQAAYSEVEVYVVSPDLKYRLNLSQNPNYSDHAPSWSPDGKKIAFVSVRPEHRSREIYTVNPDGTGLKRLTYTE